MLYLTLDRPQDFPSDHTLDRLEGEKGIPKDISITTKKIKCACICIYIHTYIYIYIYIYMAMGD